MRVISGKVRGHKLLTPQGLDVRPTLDRVKEAVFSSIMPYLSDAVVLDLFSGSGGLGIEALSRGAAYCDFVDWAMPSITATRKNLDVKIELLEPTSPESTIAKFIEKNNGNGGMHHLAFAVEDGVANALTEAEGTGIRLIDKAPRKGAEGLNIAFLHPKSTLGVLTELCENPNK